MLFESITGCIHQDLNFDTFPVCPIKNIPREILKFIKFGSSLYNDINVYAMMGQFFSNTGRNLFSLGNSISSSTMIKKS